MILQAKSVPASRLSARGGRLLVVGVLVLAAVCAGCQRQAPIVSAIAETTDGAAQKLDSSADRKEYRTKQLETPNMENTEARATDHGPSESIADRQPAYRKSFGKCMDASNGVTVDMMNCSSAEFDYQDNRLNAAYKRLHQVLPEAKWELLKDEQRKWLAEMNRACEADEDMRGGTAEMVNVTGCLLDRWVRRADELEALLDKSGH